jgi:hypothetical protein
LVDRSGELIPFALANPVRGRRSIHETGATAFLKEHSDCFRDWRFVDACGIHAGPPVFELSLDLHRNKVQRHGHPLFLSGLL